MKTSLMTLDDIYPQLSYLSDEQKVLYLLLIESGVAEDELVGTMLLLKDSKEDRGEMILYLWDERPNPQQVFDKLVEIVKRRKMGKIRSA